LDRLSLKGECKVGEKEMEMKFESSRPVVDRKRDRIDLAR
jgi:hypothetical protein